jgi:CheY-like chemotaxis protein
MTVTLPPAAYRAEGLPRSAPAEEARPEPQAASPPGRLLVVEDDSLIALELCADLSALGGEIVGPAATVAEAMKLIADWTQLDAAVLDVNLAGHSVYPVAELLEARGVPFVFCSGYQQLDDHARYVDWPLVRKPVSVRLLDRELRQFGSAA